MDFCNKSAVVGAGGGVEGLVMDDIIRVETCILDTRISRDAEIAGWLDVAPLTIYAEGLA